MSKKFNIATFWRDNHGPTGEGEYLIPTLSCKDGFQMIVSAGPMSVGCSPQKYLKTGRYKTWEVNTPYVDEPLLGAYKELWSMRYNRNVPTEIINELVEKHGGLKKYDYTIFKNSTRHLLQPEEH
jgi:hypothetical protein